MSQANGFWGQLWHRRVPQIVGMYIAATWMAVEIGDWITEKLGLSETLTLQLFVAMAAMLPTVIIITWFHGAPGKDRWTRVEKISVPLNILLAAALVSLVPSPDTRAADMVEERTLVDETGAPQVFEVAGEGFHHRVASFFWSNRGPQKDDWYAYAIPDILAEDLDRSPFIDFDPPYSLFGSGNQLAADGYPEGIGVPLALQLRMARERLIPYLVDGSYDFGDQKHTLTARLYEVKSGQLRSTFELSGPDLLPLLDEMANEIRAAVVTERPDDAAIATDLPVSEHFSGSTEAIRHYVNARNALFFDNDYDRAFEEINAALALDPTFAAAHIRAVQLHQLSGRNREALAAIDKALSVDYKVSSEDRFVLKAVRYALQQDPKKAIRVLEMWTEVHPHSVLAHRTLAQQSVMVGDIEAAAAAYERAYELDPTADQVLMELAQLRVMEGKPEQALGYVDRYVERHPDNADALLKRAEMHRRLNDYDAARADLERAAVIDSDDFGAELALAELDGRQVMFEEVGRRFDRLKARDLTPEQQVMLGVVEIKMLYAQGRIRDAMARLEAMAQVARRALSPIQEVFTVGNYHALLQTSIGHMDKALQAIAEIGARVSPPFDGFLNLSRMQVYELADEQAAYRENLEAFAEHAQRFGLPALDAFVKTGRARIALWEGRYEEAQQLYREAISAIRRSFIAAQDEYAADQFETYLAESLRKGGDYDDAARLLRGHLQRYAYNGVARLELAKTLADAGDGAGALKELDTLLEQWSDADDDFNYLADARELRSKVDASLADR